MVGEAVYVDGTGACGKIPVPSVQFCSEPKIALKNKVFLKNSLVILAIFPVFARHT